MKIISIVGTRPNFMKIAPIIDEIEKHSEIEHILVHTGQHYDEKMSKLFFDDLEIPKPDVNLEVSFRDRIEQINLVRNKLKPILEKEKPDLVFVVGDVNSTLAGAKAAHDLGIKVAHVEAGLRSFDKTMPEEHNRIETDRISDFLFTTEKSGNENLLKEGINNEKIFFIGNVMIDTLSKHRQKARDSNILDKLNLEKGNYCTLTLHRPSNVDTKEGLDNIMYVLEALQKEIKIVFPIHPRTRKNIEKFGMKSKIASMENLIITEPLGYLDFLCLMDNSKLVLTDSGGMQEETTVLGIPCITLRNTTERPITVEQGTNLLVSTDSDKVIEKSLEAINEKIKVNKSIPGLWDGKAAERIMRVISDKLKNI